MRRIAFAVMVVLAIVSILEGQLALALLFGGLKALIVGLEYMELRRAARPHAIGFALAVIALSVGLIAIT